MDVLDKQFLAGVGGAGAGGMDIQSMLGGLMGGNTGEAPAADAPQGGLMSSLGGGAGIAGLLAAAGGAATAGGQGLGAMLEQFQGGSQAPDLEDSAGLLLRAMNVVAGNRTLPANRSVEY